MPLLLMMRKGKPEMVSVKLSIPEGDGVVVVVLRGELDAADAAKVAVMHPDCAGLQEPCTAGHGITDTLRAARRRYAA